MINIRHLKYLTIVFGIVAAGAAPALASDISPAYSPESTDSYETLISLNIPLVEINTVDCEESTCDIVEHPEGADYQKSLDLEQEFSIVVDFIAKRADRIDSCVPKTEDPNGVGVLVETEQESEAVDMSGRHTDKNAPGMQMERKSMSNPDDVIGQ